MDPTKLFENLELIGKGSFGMVYKAYEKSGDRKVALKLMDLNMLDMQVDDIQREIAGLAQCNCPYITKYYSSFLQDSTLWISMEYMDRGSVADLLTQITLGEVHVAIIANQVAHGLSYMHSKNGRIHRDIKAANILLSESGDVKLADFGSSGVINGSDKRSTFVGTPLWMAPEVILQLQYDCKIDIWGFGITCIEMAMGRPPHSDKHPMRALFLIPQSDSPQLPPTFSKPFRQFVDLCLNKDPRDRPHVEALLKHPFLKKCKKKYHLAELIKRAGCNMSPNPSDSILSDDGDCGSLLSPITHFSFNVNVSPETSSTVLQYDPIVELLINIMGRAEPHQVDLMKGLVSSVQYISLKIPNFGEILANNIVSKFSATKTSL